MTISTTALFVAITAAQFLESGLAVARVLGLPVTSWRTGDPTRATFKFLAEALAEREGISVEFVKAGFLHEASGDWKTVVAKQVYGIDRVLATYATSTVVLTNSGGGYYSKAAGEVTVRSAVSGKTYRSTNAIVLNGLGSTASLEVTANESGTDSNALVDEIDEIVTTMLGVAVTSSTAAVAVDEQSDDELEIQCLATLGALSPDGPPDAYEYVVRNHDLTGEILITRAASTYDSSTGDVTVYVAGTAGAVPGASVTLAQSAVEQWATPLCLTPTVVNSTASTQAVTATVTGDGVPAGLQTSVANAYATALQALRISTTERPTILSRSSIIALIHSLAVAGGGSNISVSLTVPATDQTIAAGRVATAGAVSVT
jgi:hypothetical protein